MNGNKNVNNHTWDLRFVLFSLQCIESGPNLCMLTTKLYFEIFDNRERYNSSLGLNSCI